MSHRILKQTDDTGVVIDAVISGDMEITVEERKSLDSLTTSKPAPLPLPADWLGGPAPREGREDGQYWRTGSTCAGSVTRSCPGTRSTRPPRWSTLGPCSRSSSPPEQVLREEFAEIPARIAAEEQAIGRAAVAGEEIPTPTDWGTVKIVARAKHAEIARQVEAAAAAYHDAVKRALPT